MTTSVESLALRVRKARQEVDHDLGQFSALRDRHTEVVSEIKYFNEDIMELERVALLLTSLGEDRQTKAQDSIEALVTRGLQAIFDETLSFHITQAVKGKTSVVDFIVRTSLPDGRVVDTPVLESRGGGLAATVGFLLRLVVMLLAKDDSLDNVLVLDETFAHVSDEYLPGLGDFLRQVVDKTGIQIIMVTHQPEFTDVADQVYRFSYADGRTVVKKER